MASQTGVASEKPVTSLSGVCVGHGLASALHKLAGKWRWGRRVEGVAGRALLAASLRGLRTQTRVWGAGARKCPRLRHACTEFYRHVRMCRVEQSRPPCYHRTIQKPELEESESRTLAKSGKDGRRMLSGRVPATCPRAQRPLGHGPRRAPAAGLACRCHRAWSPTGDRTSRSLSHGF